MDLIYGRWRSQTLYAGVKLGVFEFSQRAPRSSRAVQAAVAYLVTN